MKNLLLIDIETVPCLASFQELNSTWQQLWVNKISKTMPENTDPEESYKKRAGILAEFGKVICISVGFFSGSNPAHLKLKIKSFYGDDEKDLLNQFIELCNKMSVYEPQFQFAGHNIKEFDIPFLCRRMLIQQIALPEYLQLHDKKPWEVKMFDTLSWWKFGDNKNFVSLDLLANVLGIPTSKSDIDGSRVQEVYYKEKNLKRIARYCQQDVAVTANIICRFLNQPLIEHHQIEFVNSELLDNN